jgi:hypothetical protein
VCLSASSANDAFVAVAVSGDLLGEEALDLQAQNRTAKHNRHHNNKITGGHQSRIALGQNLGARRRHRLGLRLFARLAAGAACCNAARQGPLPQLHGLARESFSRAPYAFRCSTTTAL